MSAEFEVASGVPKGSGQLLLLVYIKNLESGPQNKIGILPNTKRDFFIIKGEDRARGI